jgi:hypothetical protein
MRGDGKHCLPVSPLVPPPRGSTTPLSGGQGPPQRPPSTPWSFAQQNSRSRAWPCVGACPPLPVEFCHAKLQKQGMALRRGLSPQRPRSPVEFCPAKLQKQGMALRRGLSPLEGPAPATPPFTPWSFSPHNSRSRAEPCVGAQPCVPVPAQTARSAWYQTARSAWYQTARSAWYRNGYPAWYQNEIQFRYQNGNLFRYQNGNLFRYQNNILFWARITSYSGTRIASYSGPE